MFAKKENVRNLSLENEFINRFIASLNEDIRSTKHSSEVNYQVFRAAIEILNNRNDYPQLSVEQIIRGAMNMALNLEHSKYGMLRCELITEQQRQQFWDESDKWFGDYNNKLKEVQGQSTAWQIAIPVIENAGRSPLFMLSAFAPNTLALYFQYVKQLDNNFIIPKLPTATGSHVNLYKGYPDWNNFSFTVVPEVTKFNEVKVEYTNENQAKKEVKDTGAKVEKTTTVEQPGKEETQPKYEKTNKPLPEQNSQIRNFERQSKAIDDILNQFAVKIQSIGTHHSNAKEVAEELLKNLRQYKNEAFKDPTKAFLEQFAQKTKDSIKAVTPELQKDLGWGDYLANLTKQIVNAITTAIACIITLGTSGHQGFFTTKSSHAVQITQDLDNELDNELGPKAG